MAGYIEVLGAGALLLARPSPPLPTMNWVDAAAMVQNSGFNASTTPMSQGGFGRLPTAAQNGTWCGSDDPCPVRDKVWNIGRNSAGLYCEFESNATELWLNASLIDAPKDEPNCGTLCGSGFDLYAYDVATGAWRWVASTQNSHNRGFNYTSIDVLVRLIQGDTALYSKTTYYRLHLPIYNGIVSASIGAVAPGRVYLPRTAGNAHAARARQPRLPKVPPIVWYGTSIVNGHVASRPGMIFTTVLGRKLARGVINLGFGGNGEMERSVIKVMSQLKQAALVVIDCNWNMDPDHIRHNATSVVAQLRAEWSATKPIVMAEGTSAGAAWITPQIHLMQAARRAALAAAYAELVAGGGAAAANLHYVHGDDLIGKSGTDDLPTAMGTHPTDLGHTMIANYYAKILPGILAGTASHHVPRHAHDSTVLAMPKPTAAAGAGAGAGAGAAMVEPENASDGCAAVPIAWTDATTLSVGGRVDWGGLEREDVYDRFPLAAKADVTSGGGGPHLWPLSKCPTGEYIEFKVQGNISSLWVNYSVHERHGVNPSGGRLSIMPLVGRRGVDLYGQSADSGGWVWAGNYAGTDPENDAICGPVVGTPAAWWSGAPPSTGINTSAVTRFILYLPLWRSCSNLSIGIPAEDAAAGARLVPESGGIDRSKKPVVWYGTSIVHGAASTRAGASFVNRISRGINRTVYNFGFSGSGHMDTGIQTWLLKIDAAVYIIDCNWNMSPAEITKKLGPIVMQIRAARPGVPIVLAEGTPSGDGWVNPTTKIALNNNAFKAAYVELLVANVTGLHYIESASYYNATGPLVNPTVGGCHPSDLGAHDVATFYTQYLKSLLI